jgi:dihydrofolate reductase
MTISMIVAASENNVIGKDNQLLWNLPNDMKFFKNTTWGFPVIMGRKTFDSLGKALPGRTNIVITRQSDWKANNVQVVRTLDDSIKAAVAATDAKEIFIIGGGQIFEQALPQTNRVYLTRVHTVIDGDAYFPVLPETEWQLFSKIDFPTDEKHAYAYSFEVWDRK